MKLKIPQYQLSEVLNMMAFKGISEADIKTMMDLGILRDHPVHDPFRPWLHQRRCTLSIQPDPCDQPPDRDVSNGA